MTNHRTARVAEEIKRELSQMIREELKDQRVKGLISITSVEVSNDFHFAKIFVSKLGETAEIKETIAVLEKAGGYLRSELAKRLQLRFTPELIFKADTSIEYGAKINKILSGIIPTTEESGEKKDV